MLERARFASGSWSVFAIAFAILFALSSLWALASPIFSVPDESAHSVKAIAQVRGELTGHPVEGVRHPVVDLPAGYAYSPQILCFAFYPDQSASCGAELGDATGTPWASTWVGTYNPIYYYAIGWPSLLFTGSAGVYAMRLMSALLASLFIAAAFQISVSVRRSRWMPLAVAFIAAPMNLYLMGAVNPNGIEIASALTLWVALLRLLQSYDPARPWQSSVPRWYLWGAVTVSSVVLANARALGPLWLVLVVAFCLVVSGWRPAKALFVSVRSYWWLGAIAVGGLFSLWWTLKGGSLSGQASATDAPYVGGTFLQGFAYVIRTTPDFLQQAIGYFGWLDTPLPVWSYWPAIAAVGVLLVIAFTAMGRRSVLLLALVTAAAFLVPALVQGYSVAQTGIIWQGRYGLFLYLGVLVVAGWLLSERDGRPVAYLSSRITWIGAALIAAFGVLAFFFVLQRYVIGGALPISTMWKNPTWQPPLGWIVLFGLYCLVSLGFVVFVGRLGAAAARRDPLAEVLDGEPDSSDALPDLAVRA
ncbi:DUF2142 domain-containing protein [Cryobacterium algoricola]|uniref:DUF2142 domain-containing protein n=1 Tax=Cryobacterium algoricola TaxID=1259183 RepID=UPI00141B7FFD|nr:DUF2142 domain-containing protein [Cryobacterium algoricola]